MLYNMNSCSSKILIIACLQLAFKMAINSWYKNIAVINALVAKCIQCNELHSESQKYNNNNFINV
jgi:hypothetical protein